MDLWAAVLAIFIGPCAVHCHVGVIYLAPIARRIDAQMHETKGCVQGLWLCLSKFHSWISFNKPRLFFISSVSLSSHLLWTAHSSSLPVTQWPGTARLLCYRCAQCIFCPSCFPVLQSPYLLSPLLLPSLHSSSSLLQSPTLCSAVIILKALDSFPMSGLSLTSLDTSLCCLLLSLFCPQLFFSPHLLFTSPCICVSAGRKAEKCSRSCLVDTDIHIYIHKKTIQDVQEAFQCFSRYSANGCVQLGFTLVG